MTTEQTKQSHLQSPTEIKDRFGTQQAASKYARAHEGSRTHQREIRCIRKALGTLPADSHVLDLPSGAGRLLPELLNMGFRVTEADSSPHMIEQAKQRAQSQQISDDKVEFCVADAFDTPFEDRTFDAVVCNRLFHHFPEADSRRRALEELSRISKGPLVISFFCSYAWDTIAFYVKHAVKLRRPNDRIPIRYQVFARDVTAAGLNITSVHPMRPGLSCQWYIVVE